MADIEDPYDCKKCRMSFATLQEHRKHVHEAHSREYHPCPTCSKVFSAPSLLERHMVTHVGGKPFSCEICDKAYQVSWCSKDSGSHAGGCLSFPCALSAAVCGQQKEKLHGGGRVRREKADPWREMSCNCKGLHTCPPGSSGISFTQVSSCQES